jgi:hypothetical protein
VDRSTRKFFSEQVGRIRSIVDCGRAFRTPLRLFRARQRVQSPLVSTNSLFTFGVSAAVHRFQESIAGRPYIIEVAAVDPDRWRACIVKESGVRTSLMPFYGPTADHAAALLREWLTRAHERAAGRR